MREALLERRLLVRLAPHLVRPLPLLVAAFDGERPDRLVGVGLGLYDVMWSTPARAARRVRGERAAARAAAADARGRRTPTAAGARSATGW